MSLYISCYIDCFTQNDEVYSGECAREELHPPESLLFAKVLIDAAELC